MDVLVRNSSVIHHSIGAVRNPPLRCWNMGKLYCMKYNVRFGLYPQFGNKFHFRNVTFTKQCLENQNLMVPIHVRVWLAVRLGELDSGARLGCISPHTHEWIPACDTPHTDEFDSLEPEPSRTREPDWYVYGHLNPLNPELNPICYLLGLLGAHHFLHVSRIRVKLLNFRRLMSYIYGAPILDVSRSHTTSHHSR